MKPLYLFALVLSLVSGCTGHAGGAAAKHYTLMLPDNSPFTTWKGDKNVAPIIEGNGLNLGKMGLPITLKFETGDVVVQRESDIVLNGNIIKPSSDDKIVLVNKGGKVLVSDKI